MAPERDEGGSARDDSKWGGGKQLDSRYIWR